VLPLWHKKKDRSKNYLVTPPILFKYERRIKENPKLLILNLKIESVVESCFLEEFEKRETEI